MTNRSGQRLLEADQEQQLARRWREFGDRKAADELVISHLPLAAKLARRYKGYGLPVVDLVAEANLGLVIAAARFDPDRGTRFSTYALCWMKATILDYVLRSWSLVKIGTTSAQKKLFFGLRREMNKLGGMPMQLRPEAAKAVASSLGVSFREVIEMDCRLRGDASLNKPINDEGQSVEWEAMLVDPAPDAEAILVGHEESVLQKKALYEAINVLTRRERQVFEARRLTPKPPTLDELAHEFSISAERVRQIEVEAFAKVKRAAHDRIGAVSFGRQMANSYLPRPSVAAATPLPRTSYGAPSL
jgi:RNA polymerase sigma-32 factor